jgi:hypothetical protein
MGILLFGSLCFGAYTQCELRSAWLNTNQAATRAMKCNGACDLDANKNGLRSCTTSQPCNLEPAKRENTYTCMNTRDGTCCEPKSVSAAEQSCRIPIAIVAMQLPHRKALLQTKRKRPYRALSHLDCPASHTADMAKRQKTVLFQTVTTFASESVKPLAWNANALIPWAGILAIWGGREKRVRGTTKLASTYVKYVVEQMCASWPK